MVAAERLQRFLLLLEAECRIHRAERRQGRQAVGQEADEYACSGQGRGMNQQESTPLLKTPRLEKDREMRPLRTAPPAPSEHLRATGTPR